MRRRDLLAVLMAAAALAGRAARTNAASPPASLRELFAQTPSDEVAIGCFHEFGDGEFLFDYARNRVGRVIRDDLGRRALSATLDGGGTATTCIAYSAAAGRLRLGNRAYRRTPIRRESFTATNGAARLSAEIAAREDTMPKGTVLLIYGSGPAPKEALDFWALRFLARGFAVVTYDKRGSGRSTGDWHNADLETLAQDAAAVIDELERKGGVAKPLGVWGASQAGWIMPQLGADGLVDFIIMHAGAATTPGQQILDQVVAELTAYGFPPEEIARARAYYALDTDVSRGRAPWSEIDQAYAQAQAANAEWLLSPPAAADAPERTFIRLVADFDPAPFWGRSRVPLLAIFGGKDVIVPAGPNGTLLKALISPQTPFEELILPQSNHLCLLADSGVRAEYAKRTAIDPGYFPAIDRFLARQIKP